MFAALLIATPEEADAAAQHAETLQAVARDFSPRIECCGNREVVLDVHGLDRLIGDPPTIAEELRRTAAGRGLHVRVAIAGTRTAARLLVHARSGGSAGSEGSIGSIGSDGCVVIEPGEERRALAPLPIDLIAVVANDPNETNGPNETNKKNDRNPNRSNSPNPPNLPNLITLHRWGVRTLGELAALPDDAVAARLGQRGVMWQRLARGDDPGPLVPAAPEERFEQALDLEWPIEELEPLSFVLGRLLEPLSAHLERRDRGAAVLHVRLHLVKRNGVTREVHARSLQLPAPMRDARTLRTLALLDLESNPPPAAIDRVVVAVDPTPGRVVQFSLLTRPLPSPEQLSTLMARLTALMGEGRCGAPAEVDSWQPGACAMRPFTPRERTSRVSLGVGSWELGVGTPATLRRFRPAVPIRVRLEAGKPSRVMTDRRGLAGGRVATCAGPWRTSGAWWDSAPSKSTPSKSTPSKSTLWNRDEWDVTLAEGATYRLFHDRESGNWVLDGIVD